LTVLTEIVTEPVPFTESLIAPMEIGAGPGIGGRDGGEGVGVVLRQAASPREGSDDQEPLPVAPVNL
jgi:hypothetical protein